MMTQCDLDHSSLTTTQRRLITAHEQDPQRFRWQAVNVTSRDYSVGVGSLELRADDELSAATTLHMAEMRKQFKSVWATLRPRLKVIFQRDGQPRPQTFGEAIPHAVTDNGVFWGAQQDDKSKNVCAS